MPPHSQYQVLHHFTKKFAEAFERAGIETKLMEAKHNDPKPFLEELFKFKPDVTFSFNGLLPDDKGNFFSDLIKIPHIAGLVDSPNRFLPLITSKYTIVACPDRFGCEFFKGINFQKTFFLPHAVSKEEAHPAEAERPYDVVMLATCLEYESIPKEWRKQYPPALCDTMEEAVEATLRDNHTSYVQAFVDALDKQLSKGAAINPNSLSYPNIFEEIESYIRAKDRVELVRNIKDAHVHVFGDGTGDSTWEKYLKDKKNVTIHPSADFDQAIDIMKKAKIVLNSNPRFKNGAHERLFMGMNLGALVITNDSIFAREAFQDGKSIALYRYDQWNDLNEKINYFLTHEKERQAVVNNAKAIIEKNHTWDNRVQTVLKDAPPLIKS